MMDGKKQYRITWEERQPDGAWAPQQTIETEGFLLMADKNSGKGLHGILMNLKEAEVILMLAHFPTVRSIITDNIAPLLLAEKMGLGGNCEENGQMMDAEALLTTLEKTEPADDAPGGFLRQLKKMLRGRK